MVSRVCNHDRNRVIDLKPARTAWAAAFGHTTKRATTVDCAPYLGTINQQLSCFIVPAVDLDEIKRDVKLIVLHRSKVVRLLQVVATTADDVVSSKDRAKAATR